MSRVLAIMGSGETTPTMTGVHRALFARSTGSAVLLDTPYGFQENADDITARTLDYFDRSARAKVGVASLRSADDDPVGVATALGAVREATWVFAGPGSPSYALAQWQATGIGPVLAEKLDRAGSAGRAGGAGSAGAGSSSVVVMSSAAALTLGSHAVPVYEIYKCGQEPHWLPGLDLLASWGLPVAVIPHFDNAEGGNHDTRFCYLGERRLAVMERQLPERTWVLGVDEHTSCVLDRDADTFAVDGKGGVTVRVGGTIAARFETGTTGSIDVLRRAGSGQVSTAPRTSGVGVLVGAPVGDGVGAQAGDPVLVAAERAEAGVRLAIEGRDVDGALAAVLELESTLEEWKGDTSTTDSRDRARAIQRSLIVRIGTLAKSGARDPRDVLGPFVAIGLDARRDARARKDWAASDAIRDALSAAGVEVRDTAAGQEWVLRET